MIKYIDFHDVIECLIAAEEVRDKYTSGHSSRVGDLASVISKKIGIVDSQLEIIHMAAHMHDIGKIGIPDGILGKPGKLDQAEWEIIRQHSQIGYDILSHSHALHDIARIVLHHHERWDGKGYPHGLKGNDIPLGSRIVAVADSMDAMLSKRPYRNELSIEESFKELTANKGFQFDPFVVDALIALYETKEWISF